MQVDVLLWHQILNRSIATLLFKDIKSIWHLLVPSAVIMWLEKAAQYKDQIQSLKLLQVGGASFLIFSPSSS